MKNNELFKGWADPSFNVCLEAFRENFADDGELGAACTIYQGGKQVMNAWGGVADSNQQQPWLRHTAAPIFSCTKGVAALCVLAQVSEGKLDLDEPVARYWPEFAEFGKDRVTVREAMAHRAGVPFISGDVTMEDLSDFSTMSQRLAAEKPVFEPGSAHSYHAVTIGWITGELIRRATDKSFNQWLQHKFIGPLGLNLQIGHGAIPLEHIAHYEVPAAHDTPEFDPLSEFARPISLNGLIVPRMSGLASAVNNPAFREPELAGFNGFSDAESLARFYAATLGYINDVSLISSDIVKDATQLLSYGNDTISGLPGPNWGAGLMVPWRVQPMLGEGSFGHDGAGGALAFAHRPSGVSFAYIRNRAGLPGERDRLVYRVVEAMADCLKISLPTFP